MNRVLNIYGQPMEHMEAKIVGTRAALEALRGAIANALSQPTGRFVLGAVGEPLWASDGEGYTVEIKVKPDDWFSYSCNDEDPPFYHRVLDRGC